MVETSIPRTRGININTSVRDTNSSLPEDVLLSLEIFQLSPVVIIIPLVYMFIYHRPWASPANTITAFVFRSDISTRNVAALKEK
jgi:hypothetical protein